MAEGIDVHMVNIPEGTDPNELGKEKVKELVKETQALDFTKIMEMKLGI